MKKWIFRLLILLVGLAVLGPQPFLLLNDFHQHKTIGAVPLGMTDRFEIEWLHSVELTPWRETYSVHWLRGMELAETSFRSFGAGVPAELEDAEVTVQDGWIKVSGLHDRRESILYLVTRDDYLLRVSGRQWKLSDVLPLGTSLELSVRWFPWWYRFVHKLETKGSDG
ncbi:DUF1850 domain-containing protein [Brevibacillus borstelensis]|uniref:DUF1850 domain-containing protein n=1 Tax=Brevibacillus borstelensis TaxID=45462 RepID=UPI0030C070ED